MHAGNQHSLGADTAETANAVAVSVQAGQQDRPARPGISRVWMALAWAAGGAALFVLFLRISHTIPVNSDAANNALQGWDLLHGHVLLHGWIIGDATYYTFELPLIALVEVLFGLHSIVMNVALAVMYTIVAAGAVAIAVTGAIGTARLARAGVVVAVLGAPALVASDRWVPLGIPDHTGTSVFLLVSCLLVDRASSRRFTAPLLCVILCAGQIGDETVRYVTVPAVCVVAAYRALAARKIRTGDAAILVAAVVSVPLAIAVRAFMRHSGAYLMVSPKTKVAPVSQWPHNAAMTWDSARLLFGAHAEQHAPPAGAAAIFGYACMLAVAAGFVAVLVRWPRASRAEQVLAAAIAVNIGALVISTLPGPNTPHDLAAVLPAGGILAARLLVPARIAGRATALAVSGAAMVAALLPLSLVAAEPTANTSTTQQILDWLQAHGLNYGLANYWNASAPTLQSANKVQIRTFGLKGGRALPYPWEMNTSWYDPARHYANFIVTANNDQETVPALERTFGKPTLIHHIGGFGILVFHKNLLDEVQPPIMPPVS